jgi:CRISPR-associated protein Csm1
MQNQKNSIYLATIVRAFKRLEDYLGQEGDLQRLIDLVAPTEKAFGHIIDEAEALTVGGNIEKEAMNIPNTMMRDLLESVSVSNANVFQYEIVPGPLSITKSSFPRKKADDAPNMDYLWKRILQNLEVLQTGNDKILAENLLNILFRYALSIPSNKINLDVSLYDQTRVAASIATCLYEIDKEKQTGKPFLLIGADFSGIQKYIYQIVSKHAGKNLKGRSFYLKLLSDSIVDCLLKRLDLYLANVIYDSGGCFYLLAPNTRQVCETLESAISYIESCLFKTHGTSIYVAIDSLPVSKEEISNQEKDAGLRNVWQSLFTKRDKKKYCKFSQKIASSYLEFFCPNSVDGIKRDAISGEDFLKDEAIVKFNNSQYITLLNQQQIQLGQDLKGCDYIVASDKEIECWKTKTHIQPGKIGRYYYLLNEKDILDNIGIIKDFPDEFCIKLLNGKLGNCDYVLLKDLTYCSVNMEFYGGNTFNGRTFEEMCDNPQLSKLGILRMDVDNLGSIFQNGLAKEKSSLARYACLSRSFDFFFSGYINSIVLQKEHEDKCFIVYSGGDDLFIVGEWDTTIRIAKTIREDFRAYTCENPAFSISGGVAILDSKFPIMLGAEESSQEESNAKNHSCLDKKKDSISFMDMPLNWSREFPLVENLKNKLLNLLLAKHLPKSFLSKILLHASTAGFESHKITQVKTYWMMTYDLKRILERTQNEEAKTIVMNCQRDICENNKFLNSENITTDYHALELWAFACRWAELEYRMSNN